jgi:hypothetical protein
VPEVAELSEISGDVEMDKVPNSSPLSALLLANRPVPILPTPILDALESAPETVSLAGSRIEHLTEISIFKPPFPQSREPLPELRRQWRDDVRGLLNYSPFASAAGRRH